MNLTSVQNMLSVKKRKLNGGKLRNRPKMMLLERQVLKETMEKKRREMPCKIGQMKRVRGKVL